MRALSAITPPTKMRRCSSITPSRLSRSAMSIMPERGGMVTTLSSAKRARRFEPGLADDCGAASDDEDENQQGEDRVADDHQRIAGTSRRAGGTDGHRHVIGLQGGARTARRDAFLIQKRRGADRAGGEGAAREQAGNPLRPPGYRRLRLACAEHRPRRRHRLRPGRRHVGRGRGSPELGRAFPLRHRQIGSRLGARGYRRPIRPGCASR